MRRATQRDTLLLSGVAAVLFWSAASPVAAAPCADIYKRVQADVSRELLTQTIRANAAT